MKRCHVDTVLLPQVVLLPLSFPWRMGGKGKWSVVRGFYYAFGNFSFLFLKNIMLYNMMENKRVTSQQIAPFSLL